MKYILILFIIAGGWLIHERTKPISYRVVEDSLYIIACPDPDISFFQKYGHVEYAWSPCIVLSNWHLERE